MASLDALTPRGWTPLWIGTNTSEPCAEWALVDRPLMEPFFEQTADRAMQRPFNQVFARRTPLSVFDALGDELEQDAVAGLIFHMSRCGSTLVSQMLARLPAALVIAEAQPLDALLRLHRRSAASDDAALVRRLRGVTRAFRGHDGRRIVVKLHAWHVLELPLILRAFPGVPWVFSFREPRAVLRSQGRIPGAEIVADDLVPAYLGVRDAAEITAPDYAARVLAAFCEAALRHAAFGRSAFIDYASLPDAVVTRVVSHFGFAPSAEDLVALHAAAEVDTKGTGAPFSRSARDGTARDEPIERHAEGRLDELYFALRARAAVPA